MSTPENDLLAWSRGLLQDVTNQSVGLGTRLITWLMVGNAGALAFTFNAAVTGSSCDVRLLQIASVTFLFGLGSGFVGAVVSYIGSLLNVRQTAKVQALAARMANSSHFIGQLEASGVDVGEDHPLRRDYDDAGQTFGSMKIPLTIKGCIALSFIALILSAIALGWGLSEPARRGEVALKECVSGKASRGLPSAPVPAS